MVTLTARGGPAAASVRAIAREAGVTEAVVYRHFPDKQALLDEVHKEIIEAMIAHKVELATMGISPAEKVHEWVRLSYESFDRDPSGFTTVFLHDTEASHDRRQSETFRGILVAAGREEAEARIMTLMFASMLLTIPRLINSGEIEGPASAYAGMVAGAGCGLLGLA